MIHSELHTWTLQYCKDTLGSHRNFIALHDEIRLFKEYWPMATVNADRMGEVKITYSCRMTAEAAATQFQQAVKRHDWWREIE